jgi:hypothetical protein
MAWTAMFGRGLNYPFLRLVDHFYDLSDNLVACIVECFKGRLLDVIVPKRKLDTHLRFAGFGLGVIEALIRRPLDTVFFSRPPPICRRLNDRTA